MDIYRALIGEAPSSQDELAALAEKLRRRRAFGELGALTGDRVLQPFGQNMSNSTDAQVRQLQDTRQKDIDNRQTKSYQDSQIQHMGNVLKETMRGNNLDYAAQMAAIQQRDRAAELRSDGGREFKKLTDSTRNRILDQADTMRSTQMLIDSFKPEYTQKLGGGPQSRLPNVMSQFGLGTQSVDEAAQWWGEWRKFYTLGTRNQLFGATLTPNEQRAWAEVDINPSMDAEQIQNRITKLFEEAARSAERRVKTMAAEDYDPAVLLEAYADVLPEIELKSRGPISRGGVTRTETSSSSPSMSQDEIMQRLQQINEALGEIP
jgi:hypothetical protein